MEGNLWGPLTAERWCTHSFEEKFVDSSKSWSWGKKADLVIAGCPKPMHAEKYLRGHKYGSERKGCAERCALKELGKVSIGKWCSGAIFHVLFMPWLCLWPSLAWFFANLCCLSNTNKDPPESFNVKIWPRQCHLIQTICQQTGDGAQSNVSRCQHMSVDVSRFL